MRVVIVGASRFGAAIAEQLIEAEHEVVLVDKDHQRLEDLAERLDCGMIEGDGTLPTVLKEVYRSEEDVCVSVTNASEDNILSALVARSVGFGRVIPQIVSSELVNVCHQLDLRDVINPHATVAESIAEALEDRAALDHETALQNQLSLKRVHVPDRLAGCRFCDIDLPERARGVALIRDGEESLLDRDEELREGDHILMAVHREELDALNDCFDKSGA